MKNGEWKKVHISLLMAVIFSVICIAGFTYIDGMDGGFAIAFVSFFLAVSSIAVALLFFHRARVMDTILNGTGLLAHWIYPADIAQKTAEREYLDYRERNNAMFMVIGGMLVVAALFFLIFVEDGGFETGIFLLVLTILLFIISRVTPGLELKRALKAPHEAFISQSGIIYEGGVYPFRSFLMTMDGVSLKKAKANVPFMIVFSFTQIVGRFIVQPFDIIIPVPAGEEELARNAVRTLGGDISDDIP